MNKTGISEKSKKSQQKEPSAIIKNNSDDNK